MRLPYAPSTPPSSDPATEEIYAAVAARRAPRPLQPLDLTLLHAPPVAAGWNSFLGAVRTQTSIPTDIREIAICRVAVLNGAAYEWLHHAPLAKNQGGVSEEGMECVRDLPAEKGGERTGRGLDEKQWAVLEYTDAMTKNVTVPEDVFGTLKRLFSEREVVEITAVIAAYNCVSRFLVALDVGETSSKKIE